MGALWQDLRYGGRMLIKNPGFTLAAMVMLALGIGANTAIFSVLMTVIVRPLPFREPESLVYLWSKNQALGVNRGYFTQNDIVAFDQRAASFAQLTSWTITGVDVKGLNPERVEGMMVNTNFFQTLGVQPWLGRPFDPDDDDGAIIGYGLWQRRFGGDPNLIGQEVRLMDVSTGSRTLIGVVPPEFDFPPRTEAWLQADFQHGSNGSGNHYLRAVARLKPGVTPRQAQAELNTIARALAEESPATNTGWEVSVVPFREYLFGSTHLALLLLFGAAGCVLLMACANVANLQLVRAARRQKEIAIRLSLGAGRWRIIRQLFMESALLALAGGALGVLLALWLIKVLRTVGPASIPRLSEVTINAQALWFALAVSILTGVIFGLAPAWQASNPDLYHALKESGLPVTASPGGRSFRQLLIVSQVIMALVLLIGAGLLVKSFWRYRQIDLGFEPEQVLTAGVSLSMGDYGPSSELTKRAGVYFRRAIMRIGSLPGVASVGLISHLPLGGRGVNMVFEIKDQSRLAGRIDPVADWRIISPSYFDVLRIPLRMGRVMTERDTDTTPPVIVINETFARRYFPGRRPLGERLKVGGWESEIVGVVGDVRHRGLEAEPLPEIYTSYLQKTHFPVMHFVIRATSAPASLAAGVRRELQAIDPRQPVYNVQPMAQLFSASIAERRFNLLLLVAFAVLAASLAASGIYSVISYTVAERTREIGIRMALGAQGGEILKLMVRQGMRPALIGMALGLLASVALTRLMKSLLFGVEATDPLIFGVVMLMLAVVAVLACYIPGRRAANVDPLVALRCE